MARRARKQHNPHQLQCPYCKTKEKWCKNFSGLTQHTNSIHLDLFYSSTVDPPPPSHPSSSSPAQPSLGLEDASEEPLEAFGTDPEPEPINDDIDRDAPGVLAPHPILNGLLFLLVVF